MADFPSTTSAYGVWSLREQRDAVRGGNWPPLQLPDPNFADVSLLLHGDGTDGSTTFTDSSSNGFTVTANGNAQIDTAVVKYGTGSMQFGGSGDFLNISSPSTDLIDWFNTDYTIEAWVYADSFSGWASGDFPVLAGNKANNGVTNYWSFGPRNDATLVFHYFTGPTVYVVSTETLNTSAWNHIAMVNSSGTIKLYVNGIGTAGASISGTPQISTGTDFTINGYNNQYFSGYVDDLRITKGVARYTSDFTPPTAPFPDQ